VVEECRSSFLLKINFYRQDTKSAKKKECALRLGVSSVITADYNGQDRNSTDGFVRLFSWLSVVLLLKKTAPQRGAVTGTVISSGARKRSTVRARFLVGKNRLLEMTVPAIEKSQKTAFIHRVRYQRKRG
jgi:hypothetical protein